MNLLEFLTKLASDRTEKSYIKRSLERKHNQAKALYAKLLRDKARNMGMSPEYRPDTSYFDSETDYIPKLKVDKAIAQSNAKKAKEQAAAAAQPSAKPNTPSVTSESKRIREAKTGGPDLTKRQQRRKDINDAKGARQKKVIEDLKNSSSTSAKNTAKDTAEEVASKASKKVPKKGVSKFVKGLGVGGSAIALAGAGLYAMSRNKEASILSKVLRYSGKKSSTIADGTIRGRILKSVRNDKATNLANIKKQQAVIDGIQNKKVVELSDVATRNAAQSSLKKSNKVIGKLDTDMSEAGKRIRSTNPTPKPSMQNVEADIVENVIPEKETSLFKQLAIAGAVGTGVGGAGYLGVSAMNKKNNQV